MKKKFGHTCENCQKSYCSYEEHRKFCSEDCQAYVIYHGHPKKYPKNTIKKEKHIDYVGKWLNKKPATKNSAVHFKR